MAINANWNAELIPKGPDSLSLHRPLKGLYPVKI